MKNNKFLSALLAPMLCVSGSAMAIDKNKSVNSSDAATVKTRSNSVDQNSSDVAAKCLISGIIGSGIGAAGVGLPLRSQKNGLQETLVNLEKDKQDYEVLKRDYAKLKEENEKLEKQFESYKKIEQYFNGDRQISANIFKKFVELLPYFIDKNALPSGKLAYDKVFDGVEKVFTTPTLDPDVPEDQYFTKSLSSCKKAYNKCTDKAKIKLAEYGIKAMNFFRILSEIDNDPKTTSKSIIENLKL